MQIQNSAANDSRLSRGRIALTAFALAVLLAGCPSLPAPAPIDEGYTDYRRGDLNDNSGTGAPTSVLRKFAPQDDQNAVSFQIKPKQTFYVSLLQAYINDFFDVNDVVDAHPELKLGDVVVLVNVGEAETGGYVAFPSPTQNGTCSTPGVGLWSVFYSSDVHTNQFLNFANEPVYGPAVYCGRPVRIEVMVIRLNLLDDAVDPKQGNALRNSLRKLIAYVQGKTRAAFTPNEFAQAAGEIPDTVLALATQQRVGMLYSLVLMPPGGMSQLAYPRLEIGNYVLVRNRSRVDDAPSWGDLEIDNNTGRLVRRVPPPSPGQRGYSSAVPAPLSPAGGSPFAATAATRGPTDFTEYYRDRSYVTLQINKYDQADPTPVPPQPPQPPPKKKKRKRS